MRVLTDLEVLALLSAAPVDASGAANPREGTISPGEHYALKVCSALAPAWSRVVLARVFGLPERAPADVEPIVMELRWASEKVVPIPASNVARMMAALSSCGLGAGLMRDVEALCAEVLELRANAAAVLRADLGEDDVTEAEPLIDPQELAQAEADRAAAACSGAKP